VAQASRLPSLKLQAGRLRYFIMTPDELQSLIEDATYDHAMGAPDAAIAKLTRAAEAAPESFEAWHALAEINFSLRRLDAALVAAERAHALRPDDLFINTSLSRIWMEKGDKPRAEHYGAQAKIQSWKEQLKKPEEPA
jgi:cytochrome c-type biogenesis protein CcmH/NrfG